MNDTQRKFLEILGVAMVGEGLIGLASPRRYAAFWNMGPEPLRRLTSTLAEHPNVMRTLCAAEAGLGFWLAESLLKPKHDRLSLEC